MAIAGRRVLGDGGKLIGLWSERVHFGVKRNGYHGGLSPQEMLSPIAVLVPSIGKRPEGWMEVGLCQPAWWDLAQPETPIEAVVERTPEPPAVVSVQHPKTLFDPVEP